MRRKIFAVMIQACLLVSGLAVDAGAQAFTPGARLTFYSAGSGGACNFGAIPTTTVPFDFTVAVGPAIWDGAEICGRFIEIATPNACYAGPGGCTETELLSGGSVTVMVADRCPGCAGNDFDLSLPAFAELVDPGASGIVGRIEDADWRFVPGVFPTPIRLRNRDGVNPFYYSLIVLDHNQAVTSVEVRSAGGGAWFAYDREDLNAFTIPSGAPLPLVLPLSVRITSADGQVLEGTDVITSLDSNAIFDFGSQFATGTPFEVPLGPIVPGAILLIGSGLAIRRISARRRGEGEVAEG